MIEHLPEQVGRRGFAVVPSAVPEPELRELEEALHADGIESKVQHRSSTYAIRNLLNQHAVRALSQSRPVRSLVESVLGPTCFAVRGILFDKTPQANWFLGWHQDPTIAVKKRVETSGFGSWSLKAGVPHVRPPATVLENMLAVRVHLDDCDASNGPLMVIPESHCRGWLRQDEIAQNTVTCASVCCEVKRGGIVLMRPLLLHASGRADGQHRRVVHLEFAAHDLPNGLQWAWKV